MNENESPAAALLIDMIAAQPEIDFERIVDALKPVLPAHVYDAIALAFDMCPVHDQDLDSCRDDDVLADDLDTAYAPPLTACRHLRP